MNVGKKLPILFILKGRRGGSIEAEEIPHYPAGHVYTVQENAWMDATAWAFYVHELLRFEINGPAVLLVDNFDSHVSEEGQRVVAEDACAAVVPLPPNSTAACQPLDVGVMGPLKAKMRARYTGHVGATAREKRLNAIQATIASWDALPDTTIARSFDKAIPMYPEVHV